MGKRFFISIYLWVLSCFPKTYREEYQEELEYAVLALTEEVSANGKWSLMRLAFRELRDLPFAMVLAHIRVKWGVIMKMKPGFYLPEGHLRGWKLLAVFLPYLIAILFYMIVFIQIPAGTIQLTLVQTLFFLLLGALVLVWITGVIWGFPTWSLPGLGLVVSFVGFIIRMLVHAYVLMIKSLLPLGPLAESKAGDVITLMFRDVIFIVLMILVLTVLLRKENDFRQRVRKDWSLLSFLLYSIALPMLVFVLDEYQYMIEYQLASTLILIAGVWFFLILPGRIQRILALLLPVILAASIMSAGIYKVFPFQVFTWRIPQLRMWEAIQPLLNLPALLILLCLPVLLPKSPIFNNFDKEQSSNITNPTQPVN